MTSSKLSVETVESDRFFFNFWGVVSSVFVNIDGLLDTSKLMSLLPLEV